MPASESGVALRIVAGVDGSPSSAEALRWAVRYAELSGGTIDAGRVRLALDTGRATSGWSTDPATGRLGVDRCATRERRRPLDRPGSESERRQSDDEAKREADAHAEPFLVVPAVVAQI